jgi:hypothetical protein
LPAGTTVSLEGTPHLWIVDDAGVLHWGGDTRALEGRFVNWSDRRVVTFAQLRSLRIGDPWLSAGLLKSGDPISLVKWELDQDRPTLLHIQRIDDMDVVGINSSNYGSFVLDQAAWEARFGMSASNLPKGELGPISPTPTPTPTPTATPVRFKAREVGVNRINTVPVPSFETIIDLTDAPVGQRLAVSLEYEEYRCSPNCTSTGRGRWGPVEAGLVNAAGKVTYHDTHGPYKVYTYTFADTSGNTASITFGDDLKR